MMCWYQNDQTTNIANKFGALYNWYAINPATNGNKNVCPAGWHVPTEAEWTTLITFLGGKFLAGGKKRSTGTQFWSSPNIDATNSSGFSGLPGGTRNSDGEFPFSINDEAGYWWSLSQNYPRTAWYTLIYSDHGSISVYDGNKEDANSVRCVKD